MSYAEASAELQLHRNIYPWRREKEERDLNDPFNLLVSEQIKYKDWLEKADLIEEMKFPRLMPKHHSVT